MASYRRCGIVVRTSLAGFLLAAGVTGCSGPTDQPREAPADIGHLYDATRLVELRSLRGYPGELQTVLGVRDAGYARIADVGEDCHPDVHGSGPGRCFVIGGISRTSALLAFRTAGSTGQSLMAAAYVRDKAGWALIWERRIGLPTSLAQLIDMSSVAADDRPPAPGFDKCFRMVEGRCSY